MRFRDGWRRVVAGPGDTVVVPPGKSHHFANADAVAARAEVRTRPALAVRELLETAAAITYHATMLPLLITCLVMLVGVGIPRRG